MVKERWGSVTKIQMYFNTDLQKDVIDIIIMRDCADSDVRNLLLILMVLKYHLCLFVN
jgi:hypothetical protein